MDSMCAADRHRAASRIAISGLKVLLPFVVRSVEEEAAHVAFFLNDEQSKELRAWIVRNVEQAAAA